LISAFVHRTIEKKHLAQIKTVWPEAYVLSFQRTLNVRTGRPEPQLVVEPKIKLNISTLDQAKELMDRRSEFRRRLLEMVNQQHEHYLRAALGADHAAMTNMFDFSTQWHAGFNLETVADIRPADLPEPPSSQQSPSFLSSLHRQDEREAYQALLEKTRSSHYPRNSNNGSGSASVSASGTPAHSEPNSKDVEEELLERVRSCKSLLLRSTMVPSRELGDFDSRRLAQFDFFCRVRADFHFRVQVRAKEAALKEQMSPETKMREHRKWLLSNLPAYCDCLSSCVTGFLFCVTTPVLLLLST
jgi:hypothetical protein